MMAARLWCIIFLRIAGCAHPGIPDRVFDVVWISAFEEDTTAVSVYRTSQYKFPPSRGRESFVMRKDGSITLNAPGAADGILKLEGIWEVQGEMVYTKFAKAPDRNFKFRILSVEKSVLKIATR